jgi:hypothetical protein
LSNKILKLRASGGLFYSREMVEGRRSSSNRFRAKFELESYRTAPGQLSFLERGLVQARCWDHHPADEGATTASGTIMRPCTVTSQQRYCRCHQHYCPRDVVNHAALSCNYLSIYFTFSLAQGSLFDHKTF